MLTRLWLVFAQACTVCVAALFTISALRPEWLSRVPFVSPPAAATAVSASKPVDVTGSPLVNSTSQSNTAAVRGGFADAAGRALPSVVKIATSAERKFRHPFLDDPTFQRFFGRERGEGSGSGSGSQQLRGEGSGVIVRKDGYILTNNHVIEGAERILVELADKRVLPAKLVGTDPETDLAVIKIDGDNFPAANFGDSRLLQAGEIVLAIGNPFGVFGNTVTMGIVSAVGRTQIGEGSPFESFIQTDAAINQGNSGGALVSAAGDLVGINTSIFTRTGDFSGIGFAIPTAIAMPIMEQLIATGEVKRGYLGASLGTVTAENFERLALKAPVGAHVDAVVDGGPGARAGLRPNDVIVEVSGRPIKDRSDAINAIASVAPGQTITVKISRKGEPIEIKVTLDKRPSRPKQ